LARHESSGRQPEIDAAIGKSPLDAQNLKYVDLFRIYLRKRIPAIGLWSNSAPQQQDRLVT
jgi:hypothetical protein